MTTPLGTITPTITAWKEVAIPVGSTSLLITFATLQGNFEDVFSWVNVRRRWLYEGVNFYERTQKVYPYNDGLLHFLHPSPTAFIVSSTPCYFQMKKDYKRLSVPYEEPAWEAYIFNPT